MQGSNATTYKRSRSSKGGRPDAKRAVGGLNFVQTKLCKGKLVHPDGDHDGERTASKPVGKVTKAQAAASAKVSCFRESILS